MSSSGAGFGRMVQQQTLGAVSARRANRLSQTLPRHQARGFASNSGRRPRFSQRLNDALRSSKIQWYQIPVGLGIGFLGLVQFYKVSSREREKQQQQERDQDGEPQKRPRVKLEGPWQVRIMSTLPLKAMSRVWGMFNELTIPYYLRVPGFKLYSFIFGVNLDEVAEPDLHVYPNLAAFFYRQLKPGSRPLHPDPHMLLSPADGRVLQFGQIDGGDIEQVKGMTYSVDALLGKHTPSPSLTSNTSNVTVEGTDRKKRTLDKDEHLVAQEEEFARVNGISYTLPNLFSGEKKSWFSRKPARDASTQVSPGAVAEVSAELALGERPWYDVLSSEKANSLYYAVIYLAPGDYHRFHSPTNWVVERRRHFAGELYSVSPYLQRTLPGLFTLNERVALLGRWRWGFFGYVPVGATNVGSIKINFDKELRTNSLTTDTEADRAAAEAAKRGEAYAGFAEATYEGSSPILHGHALRRGEEMGGFQLGSTIVLVFEAPAGTAPGGAVKRGWKWSIEKGQKVNMGQALGCVIEE